MAIVQTLNKSSFIDAFMQSSRKDQFSYEALEAIFDYLEEYSDSTGEPVELDIIAICCDYVEQPYKDIAEAYGIELDEEDSEEDQLQQVKDFLETETVMIAELSDSIVYQQF